MCLKHQVQELIDSNQIQLGGVSDQGNKYAALPKKNLQSFTNPMPNYSSNFVPACDVKNDEMNVDKNDDTSDDMNDGKN